MDSTVVETSASVVVAAVPTEQEGAAEKPLSKNQLKKLRKKAEQEATREQYLAKKREKRKEYRARNKEALKRKLGEAEAAGDAELKAQLLAASNLRKVRRRRLSDTESKLEGAPRVAIDLQFEELMKDKEVNSLVKQLHYCYSINNRLEKPIRIAYTSLTGRVREDLKKQNALNWKGVTFSEEPYNKVFEHDDIVYLTAESETVLDVIEADKVYIIGGLVDRNRHKGITHERAQAAKVRTARLPIAEHMDLKSRHVLAVNHVFDILGKFYNTGDWSQALDMVMPGRMQGKVRTAAQDGDLTHDNGDSSAVDGMESDLGEEEEEGEESGGTSGLGTARVPAEKQEAL